MASPCHLAFSAEESRISAWQDARHAPKGELVVVKGAAHSIQNQERGTTGRQAVYDFLGR